MRIELFGNLQITCGEQPVTQINTNRLRSLLAFLVLQCDLPQSREHLAFLLWPESSESQARTNLRQLLHHMRRALPADCKLLSSDNQTVQWRRDSSCSIDVVEFEAAIAQAEESRKRGAAAGERQSLEQAAHICQDDLLRGLYDEWVQPKREHYRNQLEQVLARLTVLQEENRDYAAAIRYAERLVAHDPLRESHHQSLIRLHTANHDRAGALRAYHQCMRTLRRELGVEPGNTTRAMFENLLKSGTHESAAAVPVPAGGVLPADGPMVGRKKEWERLLECWRTAMRGRTQLALVMGEPGIGKSRLAEELYEWCSRRQEAVGRARCYAAQGQLAYAPVAAWLRAKPLRAASAHMPQSQLAELARVLPEILVENASIGRPGPLTESWERHHLYESLNAVFGQAQKPLLLMIDDLQWCDQDSFEWLHSLFRCEPARGILVLATVRPEETGRNHPFTRLLTELQQSGQVVELPLALLSPEETAELAAQVSDHRLNDSETAALYHNTKGNPLFVLESVRSGLGDARGEANTGNAAPPRIYAVIAARLARLSPRAYELAGLAGTIGQAFTFDLLTKATDWDEDSVALALDELWQRRVIGEVKREGQREGGREGYDFTHDRLREVAYAELSPVRRRFLHRRVARALEEMTAASHASDQAAVSGQLAAHYEAAGMAEPAIRHYREAAAVAHQRYADAEAAGLLRKALALCRDFPENAGRSEQELDLLVALGLALITTQGYSMPDVGETYARALTLSRQLNEGRHISSVLSGAWVFHTVRGQLEKSREFAQQSLDLAGDDPVRRMGGHFLLGSNLFHLGRFTESEEHFTRALEIYGDGSKSALTLFTGPDIGVFCKSYLPHVLWHLGLVDRAAEICEEAIAQARRLSHPFSLAMALNYAAMLHLFRRESGQALARAEESARISNQYDFAYYRPMAEILAGWARSMEGDVEEGLAQLREGLDSLKATGAELRLPFYHGLLAEVCASAGRPGEAMANISAGLAFQSKNGEIWAAADLHRIEGDLLLDASAAYGGNSERARSAYQRALKAARETGSRSLELRAALRLCRLANATTSSIREVLQGVYRSFDEGFETPDLREAAWFLDQVRAAGCHG